MLDRQLFGGRDVEIQQLFSENSVSEFQSQPSPLLASLLPFFLAFLGNGGWGQSAV